MTRLYSFSRVQNSPEDSQNPIRFLSTSQTEALHLYSLEVLDRDQNSQLNGSDRYFLTNHIYHSRTELSPALGQRILHYFSDPQVLRERREYLQVKAQNIEESAFTGMQTPLDNIQNLQELHLERDAIRQPHLFWSHANNLDLRLLSGERGFSPSEVREYTNVFRSLPTLRRRATPLFFYEKVVKTTGLFAGVFLGGERLIHSAFMWEMYSSNFLFSMLPGSLLEGAGLRQQIRQNLERTSQANLSQTERQSLNLQTGENRLRSMEDHLYWFLNTPILAYGCLADKNFKTFMRNPLGNFRANMTQRFLGSRAALAGGVFSRSLALFSALAVYETTSLWFDRLGGIKQGTWANRLAAGTSTLLTESALLNRVSMEMGAFTSSTAFRATSFGEMGLARFAPRAFFRGVPVLAAEGSLLRPLGTTLLVGTAIVGLTLGVGYATGLIDRRSGLGQMISRVDQAITRFLD